MNTILTANSENCETPVSLSDIKWNDIPVFEPSSTTDNALKFICAWGGPEKTIFEFGTWVGRSALAFSQNYKKVTTMDYSGGSDLQYQYNFNNKLCRPGELVREVNNVELIEENSQTYNFEHFKNQYDVVFVDGNHSDPGCTSDLNNAMLIAKTKSIIFVHDYQHLNMGVRSAVNRFIHPRKYYFPDIDIIALVNQP